MTDDKTKLIDGRFYDEQYVDVNSEYFKLYVESGLHRNAIEINQQYIDYAVWVYGLKAGAKILEAGCGVGHKIASWKERGFICRGIEVSDRARRLSKFRSQIDVGNVSNMSMYGDDEFDLIFSHGLMEHIDESVLEKTIEEFYRVGICQFHIISIDKGVDPGHIQMLTPKEWADIFARVAARTKKVEIVFISPDFLMMECREIILIASLWGVLPFPTKKFMMEHGLGKA